MQKKFLKELVLIMSLSVIATTSLNVSSATAQEENKPECEEVLQACDEALEAAEGALEAQDAEIKALLEAQEIATKRIEVLERQNASIFKNPAFSIAVGVVGGLVLGVVIAK